MNKTRILIHATIAVLLSLTAGFLVLTWLQGQGKKRPVETPQETKRELLLAVSGQSLPRGAKLAANMLTLAPYYEQSVPPGSFTDPKLLDGRVLAVPVVANEPITEEKLFPQGTTGGGLAATIAPGRRAVAVRGNKVMGLGGLILPGARVDVVMTVEDPAHNQRKITKIILENVLVLAVGAGMAPAGARGGAREEAVADTYTLEVTPDEAEKLSLAGHTGELNLALRGVLDESTVLTSGADAQKNLASFREEPAAAKGPEKARPSVEEIRGTKREHNTLGDKPQKKP